MTHDRTAEATVGAESTRGIREAVVGGVRYRGVFQASWRNKPQYLIKKQDGGGWVTAERFDSFMIAMERWRSIESPLGSREVREEDLEEAPDCGAVVKAAAGVVAAGEAAADRINALHQEAAEQAAGAVAARDRAVALAALAGIMLGQVKARLAHGAFSAWCGERLMFGDRTVSRYIQLATHLGRSGVELEPAAEALLLEDGREAAVQALASSIAQQCDGKPLTQLYQDFGIARKPAAKAAPARCADIGSVSPEEWAQHEREQVWRRWQEVIRGLSGLVCEKSWKHMKPEQMAEAREALAGALKLMPKPADVGQE